MKYKYSILGLLYWLSNSAVFAGEAAISAIPAGTSAFSIASSVNVDNGYVGLKWALGDGAVPDVVVGFRHAKVSGDGVGKSYGGDASFSFKVYDGKTVGFQPGKLRLKYFNGANYMQGEVGGGYDFKKGLFAGIGGNAPFSNVGIDYHFSDSNLVTYFMLDSLGEYQKPSPTITCPTSFSLQQNSGLCLPPAR